MKSVFVFLGIFVFASIIAWSVWSGVRSGSFEAAILKAVNEGQPTPTVFPEPTPVVWEGQVTRALAGGRGVEVRSAAVESGWFFAYRADDVVLEAAHGPVRITGLWHGISCEYGRCAPEVEIQTINFLSIDLE
jgi:hypothetical protein